MLESLHVDAAHQAIYELLVDRHALTLDQLAEESGTEPGRLAEILALLEQRGLVAQVIGEAGRYRALPPEVALEALLIDEEQRLHAVRRYAAELSTRYHRTAGQRAPAEFVEVVAGRSAVAQRVDQILNTIRHEFRGLDKPPYTTSLPRTRTELDQHVGTRLLQRGVRYRAVYAPESLAVPGRLQDLQVAMGYGEEARILHGVPIKLLIADDRFAVIPLTAPPSAATPSCVIVHSSALLDAFISVFEIAWRRALPLQLSPDGRAPSPEEPTAEEARLLALLTTGLPDEAIARQLRLSHRTLRRRIQALMARLDAATRFQAGMQAALLGWVRREGRHR